MSNIIFKEKDLKAYLVKVKKAGKSDGRITVIELTDDLSAAKTESADFSSEAIQGLPGEYRLDQNYPNPFNPETEISYQLPEAVQVRLTIFNLSGQKIRSLVNAEMAAGRHVARWDGKDESGVDVPSGVYFYTLEAGSFIDTKKMTLIK